MTPATMTNLRRTVEMENLADLHAHAGQFGPASGLMKQVNAIRGQVFGAMLDPNELRERTHEALQDDGSVE